MTAIGDTGEFALVLRQWAGGLDGDGLDRGRFSNVSWSGLAALGVFGLCTPEGGGTTVDLAEAMDELGYAAFAGPLVPTVVAAQVSDEGDRLGITSGESIVGVDFGHGAVPWGGVAASFVQIDAGTLEAWSCEPTDAAEMVRSISGEPWAVVELRRCRSLGDATGGVALGWLAQAAYLVGLGRRAVAEAAEYAGNRVQFGRPIGAFQAVSHPLADIWARVDATRHLVREVAEHGGQDLARCARVRLAAGRHVVEAAYRAYQTFGGMGFAMETSIALVGLRIREVSLLGPPKEVVQRFALGGFAV